MTEMTYEQQFLQDFSGWVDQQVEISEKAYHLAEKAKKEEPAAEAAAIRYESRLDAYHFLQGKFENYKNGKDFHDLPDLKTIDY